MTEKLNAHYAIIGAGPAGVSAAEAIRENDKSNELILVNGEKHAPYCRPLIVDVLRDERKFDEILIREKEWFENRKINLINDDPVSKLDTAKKQIELKSGKLIEFEKLLIATGSRPAYPPIDGINDIPVYTLFQQDDVNKLKPLCAKGQKVLLAGIGLIGLQAMTSLVEMGVEVIAVELMPKVLPLILDSTAAKMAQARLEEHGIDVRVGTGVQSLRSVEGKSRPYVATLGNDEEIEFDFLVMSTGMRPDLSLLNGAGIESGIGIQVSPTMETNISGIYAAGDVVEYDDWIENESIVHGHWVNATKQGRVAGLNMADSSSIEYNPVNLNSLNILGLPIITMGASRIDDPEDSTIFTLESNKRNAYSRLVLKDGILIAATFINDVERAGVFQYMLREKIEIREIAESLFKTEPDGLNFLYEHHNEVIKGDVDWPASMYAIKMFKKDHSHTRWGKEGKGGDAK